MSKTSSTNNSSSSAANQSKSTTKSASAVAAGVSSGSKTNGTTVGPSDTTAAPSAAPNWAKVAAAANKAPPATSAPPSNTATSSPNASIPNSAVQPLNGASANAPASRGTSSLRQPSVSSGSGIGSAPGSQASSHGRKPSTADAQPFTSSSRVLPLKTRTFGFFRQTFVQLMICFSLLPLHLFLMPSRSSYSIWQCERFIVGSFVVSCAATRDGHDQSKYGFWIDSICADIWSWKNEAHSLS